MQLTVDLDDTLVNDALALSDSKLADEVLATALRSYIHVRQLQKQWDVSLNGSAEQKAAQAAEFEKKKQAEDDETEKLALTYDFDTRLAVTAWVFKHLLAHLKEGGTYRYLIYDRLALDDYRTLFDGLDISNAFSDARSFREAQRVAKELRIEPMKPVLGLCDEPGCFDDATCGWPSPNGIRKTCRLHQEQP